MNLYKEIEDLNDILIINAEPGLQDRLDKLQIQFQELSQLIFSQLSEYEITQLSRHMKRPTTDDIIQAICEDFVEIHGDGYFGEDPAMMAGLAMIGDERCVVIGNQKGRNTKENIYRNFGMSKPEGYRKALKVMKLADQFALPIVCFVDTPGAYPGIEAEERGQALAIATSIYEMFEIKAPILVFIIGEGGSGGALAIGVGDRVYMLEYSTYSVISPEGCASILWKDASRANQAATALQLISQKINQLGTVIDGIIPEAIPFHWQPDKTYTEIKNKILEDFKTLNKLEKTELLKQRHERFRKIGLPVGKREVNS